MVPPVPPRVEVYPWSGAPSAAAADGASKVVRPRTDLLWIAVCRPTVRLADDGTSSEVRTPPSLFARGFGRYGSNLLYLEGLARRQGLT